MESGVPFYMAFAVAAFSAYSVFFFAARFSLRMSLVRVRGTLALKFIAYWVARSLLAFGNLNSSLPYYPEARTLASRETLLGDKTLQGFGLGTD